MRLRPAIVMAVSCALPPMSVEAQSLFPSPAIPGSPGDRPAGVTCPAGDRSQACAPPPASESKRDRGWTFELGQRTREHGRFRLEGTSSLVPTQPFGRLPSAAPPSAERWRVQQTLTYQAPAGFQLHAGISGSHGAKVPFSLQQVEDPLTVPLGGFSPEPPSLGTTWHTAFGLSRMMYDDGTRTFTIKAEAIDVINAGRRGKDPVEEAARSPKVRAVGIFGF